MEHVMLIRLDDGEPGVPGKYVTIIPATPGFQRISLFRDTETGEYFTEKRPVLGWLTEYHSGDDIEREYVFSPNPITDEGYSSNGSALNEVAFAIVYPDGRVGGDAELGVMESEEVWVKRRIEIEKEDEAVGLENPLGTLPAD